MSQMMSLSGGVQDDDNEANGNMTVDFGFVPDMSIGSTVFYDFNDDGVQDFNSSLEQGIEGVTVQLLYDVNGDGTIDPSEVIATTVTDADGNYYFGNLPSGDYMVAVTPADNAPVSSTGAAGDDQIDLDDNGTQAASGDVTYSPIVTLSAGIELTEDAGNPGADQDDLADDNGDMTIDFGFVPNQSIGSTVFVDGDDSGIQEAGEPGVPNVPVTLLADIDGDGDIDDVVATTTTDANGNYIFEGLPPGDYIVTITPPAEFPASSTYTGTTDDDVDGDDNGDQPGGAGMEIASPVITLTPGGETADEPYTGGTQDDANDTQGNMTVDFGLVPIGSIGSTVFIDEDNNGMQDPGDAGIPGITVELYLDANMDGVPDGTAIATTVTGANGEYLFDMLPVGSYIVGVPTPPTDYQLSSGPTDNTEDVDNNDDGIQATSGAPTYSGTITLTAGGEPTTGEDGFSNEDQDDDADPAYDAYGDMTVDFGFTPAVSVGSTVFLDEDNNGIQDTGELGIAGVTVNLYTAAGDLVATTVTNSDGDYYFGGLFEGDYYIEIPADQFGAGQSLADSPLSSVPGVTDTNDNGEDFDDNGIQDGGQGTVVLSPVFNLTADTEPTNADEDAQGGTQDDADDDNGDMTIDFGFVPIHFDLALIKQLAPGQPASVEPGDTIYYVITVINQGNLAADNIEVSDYIPDHMTFDGTITGNGIWTGGPTGTITTTLTDFNGADSLAMGASVDIEVALVIDSPLLPPGLVLRNEAEVSDATDQFGNPQDDVDSTPDGDDENDNELVDNDTSGNGLNGGDEDDHDWAEVTIEGFDLALLKVLADDQSSQVRPGDTIHYRIRVINQGMIAADNIEVIDYLPTDGSLYYEGGIAGNDNAGWDGSGGDPVRTLSVANGDIAAGGLMPGDSVEVSIYLTLNNPLPAGSTVDNFAEITTATDENGDPQDDIDSTPDNVNDDTLNNDNDVSGNGNDGEDEDDHDIATVEILPFDVALIKTLAAGQSDLVAPGDTVRYTITVFNQGEIPADNILISDYVPADMTFEDGAGDGTDSNTSLGWAVGGSGYPETTLSVADGELPAGGLAPGASVTIDIFLTLNSPLAGGLAIDNFAEISDATDENGDIQQDDDSVLDSDPNDDDLTSDNNTDGDGNTPLVRTMMIMTLRRSQRRPSTLP
ncbi:MAG: SdrD B-like domain-containing protein [Saprospiraceae bacterium]